MRRHLIRIRNGVMPVTPNSPAEIKANFQNEDIMAEFGMTQATPTHPSSAFFRDVVVERDFAYCIFASQQIIDEIEQLAPERRNYYMDGTFKVVPYCSFNQLLIIYCEFFQKVYIF